MIKKRCCVLFSGKLSVNSEAKLRTFCDTSLRWHSKLVDKKTKVTKLLFLIFSFAFGIKFQFEIVFPRRKQCLIQCSSVFFSRVALVLDSRVDWWYIDFHFP